MRFMMIKAPTWLCLSFAVSLFSVPSGAFANALLEFSDTLKSFRANFTQTVYDADSVVLQESSGEVVLARPGRFKWTYAAPVNQVIVADGLTLWVFDEEIKQVTKQPQSTTLGSAPIGLLSGQRDIESEFVITELGEKDSLEWFQLQPLVSDTDFNEIFLALRDGGLHAMELRDNFDQATQIVFDNFEKNLALDSDQFTFVVPEGVDVVGEGGVPDTQDDLLDDDLQSEELQNGDVKDSDPNSTEEHSTQEQNNELQSDESEPVTESPATTEQVDPATSETDTAIPATSITAPAETDPLLVDDNDPLLDDITDAEPTGISAPGSSIPGSSTPDSSTPGSSTTGQQPGTVVAPPLPNSDVELLGDADPADETDEPASSISAETPADSSVPGTVDETETPVSEIPATNTADPSREITFEERKVTD